MPDVLSLKYNQYVHGQADDGFQHRVADMIVDSSNPYIIDKILH